MEGQYQNKPLWLAILRWTARIIAILFIILICGRALSMYLGTSKFVLRLALLFQQEKIYLSLALLTLFIIGLLIGLKWEGLGGLFSLVFIAIIFITLTGFTDLSQYLLLLPSVLYLLSWHFHRKWSRQVLASGSQ